MSRLPRSTQDPTVEERLLDQQMREISRRLRLPRNVELIWTRVLTLDERETVEGSDDMGPDIIDIYRQLQDISPPRAVADLALKVDLLTDRQHERFLQELGDADIPSHLVPDWNRELGELRYAGQRVRRVRGDRIASNISMILDSFQEEGWPDWIFDPLPSKSGSQRMRDAIATLNDGLTQIRFRADGSGEGIVWCRR